VELLKLDDKVLKSETSSSLFLSYAERANELAIKRDKDPRSDLIMDKIKKLDPETDFEQGGRYHELFDELQKLEQETEIGKLSKKEKERNDRYLSVVEHTIGKLQSLNKTSVFKQPRKALENHFHFCASMFLTSSLFMPTYSGYSDGEPSYGKELYKAMEKFVR